MTEFTKEAADLLRALADEVGKLVGTISSHCSEEELTAPIVLAQAIRAIATKLEGGDR